MGHQPTGVNIAGWTYLLPELLADPNTGHNIVATVFEESRLIYRANGPVEGGERSEAGEGLKGGR